MTAPRPSLETRASGVRVSRPKPGQDRRSGEQYAADLARETDWSLRSSANWQAGLPLEDHERWPTLSSDQLGSRSGIPPHGGRWPR